VATGLLGINPYYKGVSIDISKPINLAIQLQQKEQAKAEALERYYMDYEKSINPKGLGRGEAEVFNKKFNTAREYWMKNKEAILNPRRYGMDAQSTYMAALKDAQGYIELGKQATAERKAFKDTIKFQGNFVGSTIALPFTLFEEGADMKSKINKQIIFFDIFSSSSRAVFFVSSENSIYSSEKSVVSRPCANNSIVYFFLFSTKKSKTTSYE
jgi:hypothetical protein